MTFVTVLATSPLSGTVSLAVGGIGATFTYAIDPTTENAVGLISLRAGLRYGARYLDDALYYGNTLENYVEAYEVYDTVNKINKITNEN